jgi:phosphate transport system permease protein
MSRLAIEGRYRSRTWLRRVLGPAFASACFLATLTGVLVLAILLGSVLITAFRGVADRPPGQTMSFLAYLQSLATSMPSSRPMITGFKAGIVGSLWLLGLVAAFAIPVGVGAAVFLEEYMPAGAAKQIIQTNIANLAGVPSIVYGILGLALFVRGLGVPGLRMGASLWAGALTLGLLVLPVVVIASQEAIRTVPSSLRQAALALGASRWQVVRDHVLPGALPGIMTGTILALSRAIGETAPLLMVGAAASLLYLPRGPGDRYTALPVEIYNAAKEPDPAFQPVAAGGILILLVLLLTMNATAIIIRNRASRHARG